MKRGLLMSFALISVLASILFLAAELREISYEVSGQTDTAPDHSLFMKTVITGHRFWVMEMQEKIQSSSTSSSSLSTCGVNGNPILFETALCTLQKTTVSVDLIEPVMSFCEDAFVTEQTKQVEIEGGYDGYGGGSYTVRTPVDCPEITVNIDQSLSGNVEYSLGDTNKVTIPYNFQIEEIDFDELNKKLSDGHQKCQDAFLYYDCMSTYVTTCGHDVNTLCLTFGNIEVNMHVNEANLPSGILVEQDAIKVRNPNTTFTITQFDSPVLIQPSQVQSTEIYRNKIVNGPTSYDINTLNCESVITYCNNVLTIPKTEDHVYIQFDEDKYYTFKQ